MSKRLGWNVVLLAATAGCNFYHAGDQSAPPGPQDAHPYEGAPARQVIDDGGVIGLGTEGGAVGGPGGIGIGSGSGSGKTDAGRKDGAPIDSPVFSPDGPAFGVDAGNVGCLPCTLGGQGCPGGQACYRSGGNACCAPAGELPGSVPCAEDQMCAPGLVCIDSLCTSTCNTAAPSCGAGASCRPLAAYPGAGYCAL